jgi:hypothetical protein
MFLYVLVAPAVSALVKKFIRRHEFSILIQFN